MIKQEAYEILILQEQQNTYSLYIKRKMGD